MIAILREEQGKTLVDLAKLGPQSSSISQQKSLENLVNPISSLLQIKSPKSFCKDNHILVEH